MQASRWRSHKYKKKRLCAIAGMACHHDTQLPTRVNYYHGSWLAKLSAGYQVATAVAPEWWYFFLAPYHGMVLEYSIDQYHTMVPMVPW